MIILKLGKNASTVTNLPAGSIKNPAQKSGVPFSKSFDVSVWPGSTVVVSLAAKGASCH
jgi:hypothetical protein